MFKEKKKLDFDLNTQGVKKDTNNAVSWTAAACLLVNCALGAGNIKLIYI